MATENPPASAQADAEPLDELLVTERAHWQDGPPHELFTSCEPCAMCLGAVLWSGVRRVVYAARRDDALRLSFDEGPVFPESFAYLRRRGIRIEGGPLREPAEREPTACQGRPG